MNITYTSNSNTYGDIPTGECFQIPDDDTLCLYMKVPPMMYYDRQINVLNLNDIYEPGFLGEDDIVIPVKTELKVFTN